jgi:hypothetical protein
MAEDPQDLDPLQTTPAIPKKATAEWSVETLAVPPNLTPAQIRQILGTAFFNQNALLVLHMETHPEPLVIDPLPQTYLGRNESNSSVDLHLNLTPYGAKEKGVSRIHALLRRNEFTIEIQDLDSRNGIYLNGHRVPARHLQVLRDRDEIILGVFSIRVEFLYGTAE